MELSDNYKVKMDPFKDTLRKKIHDIYPEVSISFEPIELTEKIMAQGASTPIEVRVAGKNFSNIRDYSYKLLTNLKNIPYLRDVHINQPLHYPTIKMHIDRYRLSEMGLSLNEVARSITDATSSSQFTEKFCGSMKKCLAYTYQVQVQVPGI